MKTFENKTVLITGGNSGIGKATVLAFAKEGANVVISGRRVAEGEKLAKEITSAGGSALFVRTDVAREDDIVALVEKTVGTFGALHIAFNNAGTEGQFGLLTTEQTVEHTGRSKLRGIPSPKSDRVRRTRIPTTSLVTSCNALPLSTYGLQSGSQLSRLARGLHRRHTCHSLCRPIAYCSAVGSTVILVGATLSLIESNG